MIAIALVLLVLGFLFATLQYPTPMKRFWKWGLISIGAGILLGIVIVSAIIAVDENRKPKDVWAKFPDAPAQGNPFDQFDSKPNDWVSPSATLPEGFSVDKPKAQHGPWEDFKTGTGGQPDTQLTLEERIDEALRKGHRANPDSPTVVHSESYRADGTRVDANGRIVVAPNIIDVSGGQLPPPFEATPQAISEDAFEKSLKTMHPRVAAWARLHKADLANPDRLKTALSADKTAIKLGCAPGSDCYMGVLNLDMGYGSVPFLPQSPSGK